VEASPTPFSADVEQIGVGLFGLLELIAILGGMALVSGVWLRRRNSQPTPNADEPESSDPDTEGEDDDSTETVSGMVQIVGTARAAEVHDYDEATVAAYGAVSI
jgi:hypothetical protein